MSLVYTELANDSLNGANAPTLNATNWELSTWPAGLGTAPIQILNHTAQATTNSNSCLELWKNATWASDGQYVEAEIVALEDNFSGEVDLYSLSDINIEYNYLAMVTRAGNVAFIDLLVTRGLVGGLLNGIQLAETQQPWHGNDVLRLEVFGGTQTVYWNGVPVLMSNDSSITTVSPFMPGLDIEAFNDITLNSVINFKAGTITANNWSPGDCRHYATFPNKPVTLNSTTMYTGQTSSNAGVPTPDSRALGQVADCREPSNKPEDTRNAPPF